MGFLAALAGSQQEVRWRAKVVSLKLTGDLPDVEFFWLLKRLRPGSGIYLEGLASTGNPYAIINKPRTSPEDLQTGGELFQSHCSSCHGGDGHGDQLSLFDSNFIHGDSDWAIFRNTSYGIDGTGMPPQDLPEKSIWQIIAYLRQQADALAGSDIDAILDPQMLRPITSSRILNQPAEPDNWLTYSGTLDGQRFSRLDQITPENVARLKLAWVYQGSSHDHRVQATPIVADGVLVTTEPPGTVLALDAESGRVLWGYNRKLPDDLRLCCGAVNRGVAVANSSVFVGTLDAHLVALDIRSGQVIWDVETAIHSDGYSKTAAPLVVNNMVINGVAGGEFGIRGFIDAYDVKTGNKKWRFYTVPAQENSGPDTWLGDSWRTGGGPTWMTGSYDIETNLIYWGVGNPSPDFNNAKRKGENLYTNSVVALDADTGTLSWSFQFTPDDVHDYDANSVPVVAELLINGKTTKVVMIATKNGFFYVLDAISGKFISAMEISRQTWALGIDADGRPIRDPSAMPKPTGTRVYPGAGGGANWWPPSFNPDLDVLYLPVNENGAIFFSSDQSLQPGALWLGGSTTYIPKVTRFSELRAIDPEKSEVLWERRGVLGAGGTFSTATGLVFWGNSNYLLALDSVSGDVLWKANVGGQIAAAPMTYSVNGKQHVAVSAGRGLFVFAL